MTDAKTDEAHRLASLLEKDAIAQDFKPCEMTGLSSGDEYDIANYLRALAAEHDALQEKLAEAAVVLRDLEGKITDQGFPYDGYMLVTCREAIARIAGEQE